MGTPMRLTDLCVLAIVGSLCVVAGTSPTTDMEGYVFCICCFLGVALLIYIGKDADD